MRQDSRLHDEWEGCEQGRSGGCTVHGHFMNSTPRDAEGNDERIVAEATSRPKLCLTLSPIVKVTQLVLM
jgi:hypothetical protein